MIVDRTDRRTVRSAVELAAHAPSVHNSQPWRWRLGDHTVHLYADLRRWLPVTDAEGRDLLISLGAALHHLRIALAASGLRPTVHRFPNPHEPDHIAAVELRPCAPSDVDLGLAAAIVARRSDRRAYADRKVPSGLVAQLVARAAEQGATLRPMTTSSARARINEAVAAAAAAHAALPDYHTETVLWTGHTASDDGVPAANLLRHVDARGMDRSFPPGTIDQQDTDTPDGGLVTVLGTASDDRLSQLRAGEALSAVVLHATRAGLATCPLSEVLEVGATRRALRDAVLDGTLSPQLLLRIGWAPQVRLPATPRLPVDTTIDDPRSGER